MFSGFSGELSPLITVWLQVRVLPGPPMKSGACSVLFGITAPEMPLFVHVEQPKNIGFELLADLRVADFLDSANEAGSGAIDQCVYSTECVDCGLHGCCHLRKVGYVQAHGASMVRILSLQIGKSFLFASSGDDPVALGQRCLGQLAAKAGGCAINQTRDFCVLIIPDPSAARSSSRHLDFRAGA